MNLSMIRSETAELKRTNRQRYEYRRNGGNHDNVHYIPLDMQPFYQKMDISTDDIAELNNRYSDWKSLPYCFVQNESTRHKTGETAGAVTIT